MTPDRQAIERRDFPLARRGYAPEAVDAHLAQVAADVAAELDRLERRVAGPLAPAASEQVRAILEAAERSAAEIVGAAHADAERIRADAVAEAEGLRAEVAGRLRGVLERVEGMEDELGGLGGAVAPAAPAPAPAPAPAAAPVPMPDGEPAAAPPMDGAGAGDEEGARLIALSMALDGRPREETGQYLREHFALADPERLLDEVWATVEG